MRVLALVCILLLGGLLSMGAQTAASPAQAAQPYSLSVFVDAVGLTFQALDAQGRPIDDLKPAEMGLFDNGRAPGKIIAFQFLKNFPVRAGILMDLSPSMQPIRAKNRAIAAEYAQQLLRQGTDQAFVMNFDHLSTVAQSWTSDPLALSTGIRNYNPALHGGSGHAGTALFDAIYSACLNEFGHMDSRSSANFILLFSDGEDNASRDSLQQTVDRCQHSNTAIYAFRADSTADSTGPATLAELTRETGGRVFRDNDSAAQISDDLRTIEADLRNRYRILYRPAELKRDGSFHHVEMTAPERVAHILVGSGYYAPLH